jgi:hypothetical protein
MTDIAQIQNGEQGSSVRTKLNRLVDRTQGDEPLSGYVEAVHVATLSANTVLDIDNGPIQRLTINGAVELTMPTATGGESLTLIITNTASATHSWGLSPEIVWMSEEDSLTPPSTAADTKKTSYSFLHDGQVWLGWKTGEHV